jgi:DNA-binding MarR family transcriptional regulator
MTQQELASVARIDPSSMVAVLDSLEERGIVERRVDAKDRRRRAVHLTEAGERTWQALQREARKAGMAFLEPLTPDERTKLNELLRKLAGLGDA